MHFAEAHAVQPFDKGSHALERPQLGAELVGHGALEQRGTQCIELLAVQLRWPACGHRAQCVDAAFIESTLPRVRGLSCHTNQLGCLCGLRPAEPGQLFELTPSGADLVRLLGQRLSPAICADRRHVSIATVRTQLKTVYAKTGVSSLPQLMSLVLALPGLM